MTELFFFKPIDKDESNPGISVFTVDDFGDFFGKILDLQLEYVIHYLL